MDVRGPAPAAQTVRLLCGLASMLVAALLSGCALVALCPPLGMEQPQSQPQRAVADGSRAAQATPRSPETFKQRQVGVVDLFFIGRLGNNMFQYAAARVLADSLNWSLSVQPDSHNRKKYGVLTRREGLTCFPGIRPLARGAEGADVTELKTTAFRSLREELADTSPRRIKMLDWYQSYDLFRDHKHRIRQIMALNPSCCGEAEPGPDDLVIHHRNYKDELTSDQYARLHFKDLNFKFYDSVLKDAPVDTSRGTVWVVGEFGDGDPLFVRLQETHANVRRAVTSDSPFKAFCFLMRASRLVMAHSTFSWWAAFLGNATEIHFPLTPGRRGVTDSKLVVNDEPRYVYRNDAGMVVRPPGSPAGAGSRA